jgi:hypothetical protein
VSEVNIRFLTAGVAVIVAVVVTVTGGRGVGVAEAQATPVAANRPAEITAIPIFQVLCI